MLAENVGNVKNQNNKRNQKSEELGREFVKFRIEIDTSKPRNAPGNLPTVVKVENNFHSIKTN